MKTFRPDPRNTEQAQATADDVEAVLFLDHDVKSASETLDSLAVGGVEIRLRLVIELPGLIGHPSLARRLEKFRSLGWISEKPDPAVGSSLFQIFPCLDCRNILFLRGSTVAGPGWLKCLVQCARSNPRIGAVNPLSNLHPDCPAALLPGSNPRSQSWKLSQCGPPLHPRLLRVEPSCLLVKRECLGRALLEQIEQQQQGGILVPQFSLQGFICVLADEVFVLQGAPLPSDRTGPGLGLDERIPRPAMRWAPLDSLRQGYREARNSIRQGRIGEACRRSHLVVRELPRAKRYAPRSDYFEAMTPPGALKVTYLVRSLCISGGVLSVVQLVNQLVRWGVEARIATLREYPEVRDWGLLTQPVVYRSPADLIKNCPPCDVAVATHWTTAAWARAVVRSGKARTCAYYIQDYEAWFYPRFRHRVRRRVRDSYAMIDHRIVKSDWLQTMLLRLGYSSRKIPFGLDRRVFHPRCSSRPLRSVVLAMARPRTPRRGFPDLIRTLRLVKQSHPEVEVVLFGDDLKGKGIPFTHRDEGILSDQNRLAELYSQSRVFFDGSLFHGFGRCALEAMACGSACVLTDQGGVSEYAVDGENCLLVPPGSPAEAASRIVALLRDDGLHSRLIEQGFQTAAAYDHEVEAALTLDYFKEIAGDAAPGVSRKAAKAAKAAK